MIEPHERAAIDQQNALLRDAVSIVLDDIDHVFELPEEEIRAAAEQIGVRVGLWVARLEPREHANLTIAALVELARRDYSARTEPPLP